MDIKTDGKINDAIQFPFKKKNVLPVGRAAAGIYLILKNRFSAGAEVVVPANLCYAGIYPVLYAGLKPVFCDVDAITGNVTYESFLRGTGRDTAAAVVPHMYGNPVREMKKIAEFCHNNGILLIEDCASAMGASSDAYPVGGTGDYAVYSTGYSKTLDLGYGGFVSSDCSLEELEAEEEKLPLYSEKTEEELTFFSRLYRLLRNEDHGTVIGAEIYKGLPDWCRDAFLFRLEKQQKKTLTDGLAGLRNVIDLRRHALEEYRELLSEAESILYPYEKGAVPWRLNILIPGEKRKQLIRNSLEKHLPVSDWYPAVTPMFGEIRKFEGAEKHEKQIINFPLLNDFEQKQEICKEIIEII